MRKISQEHKLWSLVDVGAKLGSATYIKPRFMTVPS